MAKIANIVLFQFGWYFSVILQTPFALLWAAGFMIVHYGYFSKLSELRQLLPITLVGLLIDTAWHFSPAITFQGPGFIIPYWLMGLWIIFPMTLNHSLSWLKGKLWLQAVLGAVGGGGSYIAGAALGAAEGGTVGLFVVAACWALWLPLFYLWLDRSKHWFPAEVSQ